MSELSHAKGQVKGAGKRFFRAAEIREALAYLRLIANPDDDYAFLRVVNIPTRGIDARTREVLHAGARQSGMSLWHEACTGGGKNKDLAGFINLVEGLRAEAQGLDLVETVEIVLARSGLVEHYQSEKEGEGRIENLNELTNAAVAFARESDDKYLVAFLAYAVFEAG